MSVKHTLHDPTGLLEFIPGEGQSKLYGPTVPADGQADYLPGCQFTKRGGAVGDQVYVNQGTVTSCAFKALPDLTGISSVPNAAQGVGASYKIARGQTALDGSNPTTVTSGLATVVSAVATLVGNVPPGVGTSLLTVDGSTGYAAGTFDVYAYKVTASGNATLANSTGTESFNWVAVGT